MRRRRLDERRFLLRQVEIGAALVQRFGVDSGDVEPETEPAAP
jgi:hypothetical protein